MSITVNNNGISGVIMSAIFFSFRIRVFLFALTDNGNYYYLPSVYYKDHDLRICLPYDLRISKSVLQI